MEDILYQLYKHLGLEQPAPKPCIIGPVQYAYFRSAMQQINEVCDRAAVEDILHSPLKIIVEVPQNI